MTIGSLLRKFRLNKEKTQREWIGDIVSPSYYSKVGRKRYSSYFCRRFNKFTEL